MQHFYRIRELAQILGFSRTMTYALVKDGHIRSVEINGVKRVPHDAIEEYLDEVHRSLAPAEEFARRFSEAVLAGGDALDEVGRWADEQLAARRQK
jgi:excisionase family DNA binding protein